MDPGLHGIRGDAEYQACLCNKKENGHTQSPPDLFSREWKLELHKLQGGDALYFWAVCVAILRMILSEKSATFRDHAEPPCKKVRNGGALRQKTENLFSMTNAVSDAANRRHVTARLFSTLSGRSLLESP